MSRLAGWGLVVLLVAAGPLSVNAAVIEVPRDALRLDHALSLAHNGDTVRVEPGRYPGPFTLPPGVRLESSRGPGATRLIAPGEPWVIRSRGGGPTTAVAGFTIEGALVGVDLDHGSLQLTRCLISGADSLGVRCGPGGHARILGTDVTDTPLGVSADPGADLMLLNCLVSRTTVGVLISAVDTRILRSRFEENGTAVRVTVLGSARLGESLREGNDFIANPVAIENQGEAPVPAEANYWGATDCDSVKAVLRGPVDFRPFTDAAHRDTLDTCP